jgi:hypothetical protein
VKGDTQERKKNMNVLAKLRDTCRGALQLLFLAFFGPGGDDVRFLTMWWTNARLFLDIIPKLGVEIDYESFQNRS